jgi:sugar O-acyltransferase (sialic acid O-acetyltransferase NeuD family)
LKQWQDINPAFKRIVMWGAADQARVNRPILEALGCKVEVLVDDTPGLVSPFNGVPLVHGWEGLCKWLSNENAAELGFVLAIGNPYGHVRSALNARLIEIGLTPVSFSDKTALISSSAVYAEGLQVMPQALVHNDVRIHRQCIINTKALVEHDCELESGVEIGPGAVLCGRVHVGANTWIGAGATIRPRVRIGKNTIVGAGAVVVSDIPDGVVVVGVPAKSLPNRKPPSAS